MKKTLVLLLILMSLIRLSAQNTAYFQQEVNYKIAVTLNDKNHTLSAFEEFEYINNSSQELEYLIIHLWPNGYKNSKTAMSKQKFQQGDYFMLWADQKAKGYIDSMDFKVDGQKVNWEYVKDYEDIAVIYLNQPLASGGSLKVTTPFFVKLPSGAISRLGHVGESYQITQWFPKPAVFDQDGWHEMPYLTQGEFYSEYGSFDISITLPENYVVGATGDLQTQSEIDYMNKLSKLPLPASKNAPIVLPTLNKKEETTFPPSSPVLKTIQFKQQNIHDFGWFADKRWIVRKGEVELPHGKNKVTTWALFTPENAAIWDSAGIKAINNGLYYYSLWTGDYPYKVCTAVDGTISAGGGMEYPNVTVIGNAGSEQTLATVIIHEVGHNWFYGILGSNERDNAWMDEGINSFFETRTVLATTKNPGALDVNIGGISGGKLLGLDKFSYQYLTEELPFLISARGSMDQPIQAPSEYFTSLNYGTIVYKKTAIAFNYLMNYLGEDNFNQCMANYFEAWKFKHPSPENIREIFEQTSGKDLTWFFEDLLYTKNHIDYKAISIRMKKDSAELVVKNDGGIRGPFSVDIIRNGALYKRQWFDGITSLEKTTVSLDAVRGDIIKLNNVQGIPEYNRNNNNIRTRGMLKRTEPYKLKLLTGVDDPESSQVFWNPLIGWNNYNKWMLGIQLHNITVPEKNYKWSIAPMYSIATKTLIGFAKFEYDNGKIAFGVRGQRFALDDFPYNSNEVRSYDVIAPFIKAVLFTDRLQKDWTGEVGVTLFSLGEMIKNDNSKFIGEYTQIYPGYGEGPRVNHLRIRSIVNKKLPRTEFGLQSNFEGGEYTNWSIFHQHTFTCDYVYRGQGKKKIRTRLYYGGGDGFYLNAAGQYGSNRYDKNSPKNNIGSDYAYDGLFLGRSETTGLLSQQFMRTQGGLAAPTTQSSNGQLLSCNAEIDAPFKFPLSIYGGIAMLKNQSEKVAVDSTQPVAEITIGKKRILWNAGIGVPLIRNVFHIYIPVMYSSNIKDEIKARDLSFGQTIMFELNLSMINPLALIKNIGN